jgi:hypothetical protein
MRRSLILTALDSGERGRTAAELDALFAATERLLAGS